MADQFKGVGIINSPRDFYDRYPELETPATDFSLEGWRPLKYFNYQELYCNDNKGFGWEISGSEILGKQKSDDIIRISSDLVANFVRNNDGLAAIIVTNEKTKDVENFNSMGVFWLSRTRVPVLPLYTVWFTQFDMSKFPNLLDKNEELCVVDKARGKDNETMPYVNIRVPDGSSSQLTYLLNLCVENSRNANDLDLVNSTIESQLITELGKRRVQIHFYGRDKYWLPKASSASPNSNNKKKNDNSSGVNPQKQRDHNYDHEIG